MTPPLILVVEDEALLGLDLATTLEDAGWQVLGPYNTGEKALAAIEQTMPDAAVLDVNLGYGRTSMEVADALREAGRPFVFLSGYAGMDAMMDHRFRRVARLGKPCQPAALREAVATMLAEAQRCT